MNLTELGKALDLIGMPARLIALGGRADNSWCVEQSPDGTFEVFWCERGSTLNSAVFQTEGDACFYLLGRLAYSQLLARTIGRL